MVGQNINFTVELTDNSPEVLAGLNNAIARALWAIGNAAAGHAQDYETRIDTGRLNGSITHKETENATMIGTNVEYAAAHEFGTSRGLSGLHYLQKAASGHTDEYKALIKNSLENA